VAVARTFLLGGPGHMAQNSCTRCVIPGDSIGTTVYFYDNRQYELRTEDNYLKERKVCCLPLLIKDKIILILS